MGENGIRRSVYFSKDDLDLLDFIKKQPETFNASVIKLLRNCKDEEDNRREEITLIKEVLDEVLNKVSLIEESVNNTKHTKIDTSEAQPSSSNSKRAWGLDDDLTVMDDV